MDETTDNYFDDDDTIDTSSDTSDSLFDSINVDEDDLKFDDFPEVMTEGYEDSKLELEDYNENLDDTTININSETKESLDEEFNLVESDYDELSDIKNNTDLTDEEKDKRIDEWAEKIVERMSENQDDSDDPKKPLQKTLKR